MGRRTFQFTPNPATQKYYTADILGYFFPDASSACRNPFNKSGSRYMQLNGCLNTWTHSYTFSLRNSPRTLGQAGLPLTQFPSFVDEEITRLGPRD